MLLEFTIPQACSRQTRRQVDLQTAIARFCYVLQIGPKKNCPIKAWQYHSAKSASPNPSLLLPHLSRPLTGPKLNPVDLLVKIEIFCPHWLWKRLKNCL
jgi:hypothetical protein